MKKIILVLTLVLIISAGCSVGVNEKVAINAVLNSFSAGMVEENVNKTLACFADSVTMISKDGTTQTLNQAQLSLSLGLAFAFADFSAYDFNNRQITVTGNAAKVTCTRHIVEDFSGESNDNLEFSLTKDSTWKITQQKELP